MYKYRVVTKSVNADTQGGALQSIIHFDPEVQIEPQSQNELTEMYEVTTHYNIEQLLDVSEGVISYILV